MADWPKQEFSSLEAFWNAVGPMGYRAFHQVCLETNPVRMRYRTVTVCHRVPNEPGCVALKDHCGMHFEAHERSLLNCASTMFTDAGRARQYLTEANRILEGRKS